MKCPICKSECSRDEHSDGLTFGYGLYQCSKCEWFEERAKQNEEDLDDLPF